MGQHLTWFHLIWWKEEGRQKSRRQVLQQNKLRRAMMFCSRVNYCLRPPSAPPPSPHLWTITTHFLLETQTKWRMFCNSKQQTDLWSNLGSLQPHMKLYLHCCCGYFHHFPEISIRAVLAQIRSLGRTICPQHWSQIGRDRKQRETGNSKTWRQISLSDSTNPDWRTHAFWFRKIFTKKLQPFLLCFKHLN